MRLLFSLHIRPVPVKWICQSCRSVSTRPSSLPSRQGFPNLKAGTTIQNAARTRFAPSPTGYLHLGSLRTALYNYVIAKATGGQFLLRIEDTDQKRTVPDAEERLFRDLEWAGIEWDEGPKKGGSFGPYKQSERLPLYKEHAEELVQSGHAYRCFCSQKRLDELKGSQPIGAPGSYDRACTKIGKEESDDRASKGEDHSIRLLTPDSGRYVLMFTDLVHGKVRGHHNPRKPGTATYEDPILLKSDGFPTYHLANVVDDHLMEISHVIRGSEWLSSTPKHIFMYDAFGWKPPNFAHVSLLQDTNGQKLSKRSASMDLDLWKEKGVFPETLVNFVALLGWSHKLKSDVMGMAKLIENAEFRFTVGNTTVSEDKLWYLQKQWAKEYTSRTSNMHESPLYSLAVKPIVNILNTSNFPLYDAIPAGEAREQHVFTLLQMTASSVYKGPKEFVAQNHYFFNVPSKETLEQTPVKINALEDSRLDTINSAAPSVPAFLRSYAEISEEDWNPQHTGPHTHSFAREESARSCEAFGEEADLDGSIQRRWNSVTHIILRWALLCGASGPASLEMMSFLGRAECIRRLELAADVLSDRIENEGFGSMDDMPPPTPKEVVNPEDLNKGANETEEKKNKNVDEAFGSLDG